MNGDRKMKFGWLDDTADGKHNRVEFVDLSNELASRDKVLFATASFDRLYGCFRHLINEIITRPVN